MNSRVIKYFLRSFGILAILFLLMGIINTFSEKPTPQYHSQKCTRYCHDRGCHHFAETQTSLKGLSSIYVDNIRWLKNNPIPNAYAANNLLIYVILYPLLFAGLLFNFIRLRNGRNRE